MKEAIAGIVAAGLAICLAAGWCGGGEAVAAGRAADAAFLTTLWHGLTVERERRLDAVYKKIDWAALAREAAKAPDADERARRERLVALWQVLARLHDFGRICAAPCVFERKALLLLKGDEASLRTVRKVLGRFGEPKDVAFDPTRFRRYLATEPLPPWAVGLRAVAAAVLAGEGDREGMRRLVGIFRSSLAKDAGGRGLQVRALWTAVFGAQTEAALPLWAEVLGDELEAVRKWAVQNVALVHSERAEPLLVARLGDRAYAVRREAALKLMARERRESIPVLQEILRRELKADLRAALEMAPICCALERWRVADVPWARLEGLLSETARSDDGAHWKAITLAGYCLSAGRTKVSVPFLEVSLEARHEQVAHHAAHTLLRNGSRLGIATVARHIATATKQWSEAYNGLLALGEFLGRGQVTAEDRAAVLAIARQAWERRQELSGSSASRLPEVLGEMGMLLRVVEDDDGLRLTTVIDIPHAAAGRPQCPPLFRLVNARLASVAASAKQLAITLPQGFLARCRRDEFAALEALARGADPDLAREAKGALKILREAAED